LLIEPADLAKSDHQRLVILDARDSKKYAAGHIPGARWIDQPTWAKAFRDGQDVGEWGRRLAEFGIDGKRPVVVYDDTMSKDAARIWWILRYWDTGDVRLLNGGWPGWQAAGLPTSTDVPSPAPPGKLAPQPRGERLATKDLVVRSLPGNGRQIIDTRSASEFCGTEKMAKRAGAIPTAKHLEWKDLLDAKTQRFKTAEDLRRLFQDAGIDPKKPAITYCHSGGRAAVMAFALELMGGDDVRNYYASWGEWGNADDTPVEAGKKQGDR
jgi:thiosulfate/3-mercaptopyruvate sulfurtransferase